LSCEAVSDTETRGYAVVWVGTRPVAGPSDSSHPILQYQFMSV